MKTKLNEEEYYYAIIMPSYAFAPDGTFLFPTKMACGCEFTDWLNKDKKPDKNNLIMSVKSCNEHTALVKQSQIKMTLQQSHDNYFWTKDQVYPIAQGLTREKILHGEDFAEI